MSHDRQSEVYTQFDAELRARLRATIDEPMLAEHARAPFGPHSDALARVENYFRRAPMAGRYIVVEVEPWSDYRIGVLTGVRGDPVRLLEDGERYPTERAAAHGLFLRRVRDLMHGDAT